MADGSKLERAAKVVQVAAGKGRDSPYDEWGEALIGYAALCQIATTIILIGQVFSWYGGDIALGVAALLFVTGLLLYGIGTSRKREPST